VRVPPGEGSTCGKVSSPGCSMEDQGEGGMEALPRNEGGAPLSLSTTRWSSNSALLYTPSCSASMSLSVDRADSCGGDAGGGVSQTTGCSQLVRKRKAHL